MHDGAHWYTAIELRWREFEEGTIVATRIVLPDVADVQPQEFQSQDDLQQGLVFCMKKLRKASKIRGCCFKL
jgi:hypothetical protein